MRQRCNGLGTRASEGERLKRQPNPKALIFTKPQRCRHDRTNLVHVGDKVGVGREVVGIGPGSQMDRLFTGQACVDLFGDHRQERRRQLQEVDEHRVERVISVLLVVGHIWTPEAVSASADVPVVERVEERADLLGRPGEVVGLHAVGGGFDDRAHLGEDVLVELVGRVGAHLRLVAVDVRVEREERIRVPHGQHDLAGHLVDAAIRNAGIATTNDVRVHEVPAQRVGALLVEDLGGLGVVAELLRQLLAIFGEKDAVTDHVLERRLVEQRASKNVQRVEPAAGLVDVLDDEIGRVVLFKPLLVLEWIVHLGEWHRAALEPAVEHLGHAAHHRLAGRVVGVRANQLVDVGTMQVGRADAEVGFELVEAAIDIDAWVLGVITAPHRDWRTPETVAADRPVACAFEPLAEAAVLHVVGNPVDVLVQLDQAITEIGDLHIPTWQGAVDDRRVGAPAVRIVVLVRLVSDQATKVLDVADDVAVGLEDVAALKVRDLGGEAALVVHWHDHAHVVLFGDSLVVFAKAGRRVDNAGALFGLDKVARHDPESVEVVTIGEVGE